MAEEKEDLYSWAENDSKQAEFVTTVDGIYIGPNDLKVGGITLAEETTKLADKIGMPAMLEMMAEEATELAHACQKAARLLRDENPSPGHTMDELMDQVEEEMADVYICLREMRKTQYVNNTHVSSAIDKKRERMNRRLGMRAETFIF